MLLRISLSACEPSLPSVDEDQYAYRSGTTAVQACAQWPRACQDSVCGMGRDLAKCYDHVPHCIGKAALDLAGVPDKVRAITQAAWVAPRRCVVQNKVSEGEL